jgi:hypothetical protein
MIATFCYAQDNYAVKSEPLRILSKNPGAAAMRLQRALRMWLIGLTCETPDVG